MQNINEPPGVFGIGAKIVFAFQRFGRPGNMNHIIEAPGLFQLTLKGRFIIEMQVQKLYFISCKIRTVAGRPYASRNLPTPGQGVVDQRTTDKPICSCNENALHI